MILVDVYDTMCTKESNEKNKTSFFTLNEKNKYDRQ